jgi:hypothetical protein
VEPFLTAANLAIPTSTETAVISRTAHTPHLADLVADLQAVARLDRQAVW